MGAGEIGSLCRDSAVIVMGSAGGIGEDVLGGLGGFEFGVGLPCCGMWMCDAGAKELGVEVVIQLGLSWAGELGGEYGDGRLFSRQAGG